MAEKTAKKTDDAPPSFEAAMERLDEIVSEMENAELPLDQIVDRYEEGTRLRKFCEAKLAAAEQRVQKITPGADGAPAFAPLDEDDGGGAPDAPAPEKKKKAARDESFLL